MRKGRGSPGSDVISGDSGAATYDKDGKVVGMTAAGVERSADVVGYAVPIAKVLRIADDLEGGVTRSGYDYGYPPSSASGSATPPARCRASTRACPPPRRASSPGTRSPRSTVRGEHVHGAPARGRSPLARRPGQRDLD
jgi:S1-C subfamily serine protease